MVVVSLEKERVRVLHSRVPTFIPFVINTRTFSVWFTFHGKKITALKEIYTYRYYSIDVWWIEEVHILRFWSFLPWFVPIQHHQPTIVPTYTHNKNPSRTNHTQRCVFFVNWFHGPTNTTTTTIVLRGDFIVHINSTIIIILIVLLDSITSITVPIHTPHRNTYTTTHHKDDDSFQPTTHCDYDESE